MNVEIDPLLDSLLKVTDSLSRAGHQAGSTDHELSQLLEKYLDVLRDTKRLFAKDPHAALQAIRKEDELAWAINRLEEVISRNRL